MNTKTTVIGFNVLMILKLFLNYGNQKMHLLFQPYFFQPMCFLYAFDSFPLTLLKQGFKTWLINEVMEILQ